MFSLLTKAKHLSLTIDIQCDLYEKIVLPILLYGSEVWDYSNIIQIEVFYRNFLRRILYVGRYTPNCMVYRELGRKRIASYIDKRIFSFWVNLYEGKSSKLSTLIYRLLYKMYEMNTFKSEWIHKAKSILDNCGFSYI